MASHYRRTLDEDELISLHTRVRRARGKSANARNADKAEVFEEALSRVSRRLAAVSRESARELKEQRLARARDDAPSFSDLDHSGGKVRSAGKARVDVTRESAGRKKYEASTAAAGARRQAKKDRR